jgi:diaminopimelate decarboxylase
VQELAAVRRAAAQVGKIADVSLRVNPDVSAGGHDKISTGKSDSKFGLSVEDALYHYKAAAQDKALNVRGLAVHIGSQIKDLAPLERAFGVMRDMVEALRGDGFSVERLDLGGGLGVPYFNEPDPPSPQDYAAMVARVLGDLDIRLCFEPGRMIAANAGVLLARVVRVQVRAQRPILVLDAAMNDLIRPAIYDAFHDIKPLREPHDASTCAYDVVGPICETGDTFTRNRLLAPLGGDDVVAFMTAGAYGATMASTYNARALVPEVLVRGDRFEVVRRRWAVSEQLKLEQRPSWLT